MSRLKWSNYEINFLIENYKKKGVDYILSHLKGRTRYGICKKAQKLKLTVDKTIYSYNEELVRKIVNDSLSYKEVLRKLDKVSSGNSYKYLKKYIVSKNINIDHFDPWKHNRVHNDKRIKSLEDLLIVGSNIGSSVLKEKLYKARIKNRICELCQQDENWKGKKMSLILDHINGINNDNRLENLRIVCPNCNATLDTHCSKNRKR